VVLAVDIMDLQQVKKEIGNLGQSPAAEKMYPITSNWVPITDVLAVINRFEKYWKRYKVPQQEPAKDLIAEIIGQ
jgi:hypothetical protein